MTSGPMERYVLSESKTLVIYQELMQYLPAWKGNYPGVRESGDVYFRHWGDTFIRGCLKSKETICGAKPQTRKGI